MQLRDAGHDCEPEPVAARLAVTAVVDAREGLEDGVSLVLGNALPVVLDAQ